MPNKTGFENNVVVVIRRFDVAEKMAYIQGKLDVGINIKYFFSKLNHSNFSAKQKLFRSLESVYHGISDSNPSKKVISLKFDETEGVFRNHVTLIWRLQVFSRSRWLSIAHDVSMTLTGCFLSLLPVVIEARDVSTTS